MAITIPETLNENNSRMAVRVTLSAKDPVRFAAARQKVVLENISESGIAFKVDKPIEGKRIKGVLKFRIDQVYTMHLTLEFLTIIENSYRAKFVDVDDAQQKLLSRLVLGLQKLHIRRRKQQKLDAMAKKAEADGTIGKMPEKLEFNFSNKKKAKVKKAK